MKDSIKDYVGTILWNSANHGDDAHLVDLCERLLVMVWENLPDNKKEVITHACERNYYNTSTYEMSHVMCYVYTSGIEYEFSGTRTGFNLFVDTNGVIGRKKKGILIAKVDVQNIIDDLNFEKFTYRGGIDRSLNLGQIYSKYYY